MKEHDKLELSERSRPNGNAGAAWESRVVKFADSYEETRQVSVRLGFRQNWKDG